MIFTVNHSNGFIGVFSSMDEVKKRVLEYWSHLSFFVQQWNRDVEKNNKDVWVIFYKDTEYVAYVSTNEKDAEDALQKFNNASLVYSESLKYNTFQLNGITENVHNFTTSLDKMLELHKSIEYDCSNTVVIM